MPNFRYTTVNGTPPYTFEILDGALPDGISLDPSTGFLTGTAMTAGDYSWTVRATDSSTVPQQTDMPDDATISMADPLVITGGAPGGDIGTPYVFAYTTAGGLGPYTYAVTAGSVPDGLFLSPSTGVLSGNPITAETSGFTVTVTDSGGFTDPVDESVEITGEATPVHQYWRVEVLAIHGVSTFLLQQGQSGLSEAPWGTFEANAGQAASSESFESVFGMFIVGSRWSTNFSGYEWVSIDLGTPKPVVALLLRGNSSFPERTIKDFNIQWSDDGTAWVTSALYRNVDLTTDTTYTFPLYQNTVADPFFDFDDVLMHFNGANGSTTMTDEIGHTATVNGAANISTVESRFGGSSLECIVSGAWVDVADAGDFGTDDFTIEGWVRNEGNHLAIFIDYRPTLTSGFYPCIVVENGTVYPFVNNAALIPASARMTDSEFHFVRWHRFRGVSYFYLDRVLVGSVADTNNYLGGRLRLGSSGYDPSTVSPFGYIDEVRVTRGFSRRHYNVPQTAQWGLSGVGAVDRYFDSTLLLMNWPGASGDTTYTDATGYHTFNANGTPPLLDGSHGIIFDGSAGQSIRAAASDLNYLMGDFCIEFSFTCTNGAGNRYLFAFGNNVLLCTVLSNSIKVYTSVTGTGGSLYAGAAVVDGTPYTVVIQRKAGKLSAWLNNTLWGSQACNALLASNAITIGNNGDDTVPFIGTIGAMRMTKTFRYAAASVISQNASPYPTTGDVPVGSVKAKKWRVFITNNNNNHSGFTTVPELQLRRLPGGYDLTDVIGLDTAPLGSAAVNSDNAFKYAFDDNLTTKWTSNTEFPCWIGWDFKFPTRIMEMVIAGNYSTGDQANLAPSDFKLQYFDETTSAWVSLTSVANQNAWGGGEVRPYLVRSADIGLHDFWRMNITANNGGAYEVIAEMELRESIGGADQTSPAHAVARAFASAWNVSGNSSDHAFDDDSTTAWGANYRNTLFLGWHERLSVREVSINAIGSIGSTDWGPVDFTFEYSDDGVSFTVVKDVTGEASFAANEIRTYSW